ncbi:hypothetical protein GUITHDRAFT_148600 [Guillardia theta CCMP2712]|uniref:Uncharacterized protein n=1 Tax=Guillardia theta (strain CCMP2712) TaxID=905079 RepID=L1I8D0_GUITC|nr:hypothetical protein GUITHDRAFT_148600 [Guillardia theta CCMP2712]EKX32488.1 hypothetical protein GUITHDRAFT_148600 [Guillardia theta CCMP2712]|eukprot:XP_005819468.1 hypothetical protein GUITHDRAFT_148600 [Guillardia theta CCMP2712]
MRKVGPLKPSRCRTRSEIICTQALIAIASDRILRHPRRNELSTNASIPAIIIRNAFLAMTIASSSVFMPSMLVWGRGVRTATALPVLAPRPLALQPQAACFKRSNMGLRMQLKPNEPESQASMKEERRGRGEGTDIVLGHRLHLRFFPGPSSGPPLGLRAFRTGVDKVRDEALSYLKEAREIIGDDAPDQTSAYLLALRMSTRDMEREMEYKWALKEMEREMMRNAETQPHKENTETPQKDTETPQKNTETPQKNTETPQKNTETPQKDTETPQKDIETPQKDTETPQKENTYETYQLQALEQEANIVELNASQQTFQAEAEMQLKIQRCEQLVHYYKRQLSDLTQRSASICLTCAG